MALTSRMVLDEDDYERIRALARHIHNTTGPPNYASTGRLDWWRYGWGGGPDDMSSARIWSDGAALVGVAWEGFGRVRILTHPGYRDLEGALLEWAVARRARQRAPSSPATFGLVASALDEDAARQEALRAQGFAPTEAHQTYLWRSLGEPMAERPLPEGYRLDRMRGGDDAPDRAEVHNAAFPGQRLSAEAYRALASAPTYRPDLDLVIRDPGGAIAAFVLAWYDEETLHGTLAPVGCHPDHRRLGLTRALVYEALHQLKTYGAVTADASTGHDNPAGAQLYGTMGFQPLGELTDWFKAIG